VYFKRRDKGLRTFRRGEEVDLPDSLAELYAGFTITTGNEDPVRCDTSVASHSCGLDLWY
jgi:hypothetical protein